MEGLEGPAPSVEELEDELEGPAPSTEELEGPAPSEEDLERPVPSSINSLRFLAARSLLPGLARFRRHPPPTFRLGP